jgi:hypothetical protein
MSDFLLICNLGSAVVTYESVAGPAFDFSRFLPCSDLANVVVLWRIDSLLSGGSVNNDLFWAMTP